MAQASAADSRDQPSSNSAIASLRREARASWVRAAAARKSASVRSKRVIATVIAIPLLSQERRITPYRVAPIHLRVSGPGDWYDFSGKPLRLDHVVLEDFHGSGHGSQ